MSGPLVVSTATANLLPGARFRQAWDQVVDGFRILLDVADECPFVEID